MDKRMAVGAGEFPDAQAPVHHGQARGRHGQENFLTRRRLSIMDKRVTVTARRIS
jgi:hypothetical protein